MDQATVYRGSSYTVEYAVLPSGRIPSKEFIDSLKRGDKTRVITIIERLGDYGEVRNQKKFKKIQGTSFFEVKSFQVRIPGFFAPGKRFILTHGFIKKTDSIPKPELDRAATIKKNCLNQGGGTTQ